MIGIINTTKYEAFFYIYIYALHVCLFVCLSPINVKTAELIGPKFFVGPYVTRGKVYELLKIQIFASNKIRFFFKSTNFFIKSAKFCLFLFNNVCKENMIKIEIEDGPSVRIFKNGLICQSFKKDIKL